MVQIAIIIYTYDRYQLLKDLIDDLHLELPNKFQADLYLYDDASPQPQIYQSRHYPKFRQINYHRFTNNHGRPRWYQMIHHIFQELKKQPIRYDYYLWTSDDMKLRPDFFNKAINLYQSIHDHKLICLNLHNDRGAIPCWTGYQPIRKSPEIWLSNWVDMCFLCTKKLLEALNWGLHHFKLPKTGGSGVGAHLSRTLYHQGYHLYLVHNSLVIHQATHHSKMHPQYRKKNPLISRYENSPKLTQKQKPSPPKPKPSPPKPKPSPTKPKVTIPPKSKPNPIRLHFKRPKSNRPRVIRVIKQA